MVFKPFTHLARQKFIKSFTHGYAQTVVAASQTSYAASTSSFPSFTQHGIGRYGKTNAPQAHNAFQCGSSSAGAGTKATSSVSGHQNDSGLAAYYAAWHQQQQTSEDGVPEWTQYQFAKRIGWRTSSSIREAPDNGTVTAGAADGDGSPLQRAEPSSEPRDDRSSGVDAVDQSESGKGRLGSDLVLTREYSPVQPAQQDVEATLIEVGKYVPQIAKASNADAITVADQSSIATTEKNLALTPTHSPDSELSLSYRSTSGTPFSEPRSQAFSDHIDELYTAKRYAEVPATFEALLAAKEKPTTKAYNALLTAAVHIPAGKHQAISKVLSVFSDMRRRQVSPDTLTYSILIETLASRALELASSRRSLIERRARFDRSQGIGKSLFSLEYDVEQDILAEDDSGGITLRLFNLFQNETNLPALPLTTYQYVIAVCAEDGKAADFIAIYAHMERHQVVPSADMFLSMITGFAKAKDLVSAQECYNEYKALAVAADNGHLSIINRADEKVYTALMSAYVMCDKANGAARFLDKIRQQYLDTADEANHKRLTFLDDLAIPEAFVEELLKAGRVEEASSWAETAKMSPSVFEKTWARICGVAADRNEAELAIRAFERLASFSPGQQTAAVALLALHLRGGDLRLAGKYWDVLSSNTSPWSTSLVEPSAMYVASLLEHGQQAAALDLARRAFERIRTDTACTHEQPYTVEAIDGAIEALGLYMRDHGISLLAKPSVELLRIMMKNGGIINPIARQLLAGLGPESLKQLSSDDLMLLIRVQGGSILRATTLPDLPDVMRFAQLLETIMSGEIPLDQRTTELVEQVLPRLQTSHVSNGRPDLVLKWRDFLGRTAQGFPARLSLASSRTGNPISTPVQQNTAYDPHAASIDHRGSSIIADMLERRADRSDKSRVKDALSALKNIRRVGRHPRYATYAKLISAAAREHKIDLAHDVLHMAKVDVPFLSGYLEVEQGWTIILDAMVAACLTLGDRNSALKYHQELSDMGSFPSANTFGLYITTLKESTKTFDEATEALKIFRRAITDGVEPTSFLYNALIGKLGKARRIDDCLYYFGEMRNLGIQPTSVTYGTIVNALCRVSDEKHAEQLFEEMESMPNYKPRPAPYNSLMQFFLTTKRDRAKVLAYYDRMRMMRIPPASHTFKLLIDAYATLEPIDMPSAETVLDQMRQSGLQPEAVHYASLIHAKGCTMHNMDGAQKIFDDVLNDSRITPQACIYQAYLEAMVANHRVPETDGVLDAMRRRGVAMTPYIANTLIHGWALKGDIAMAKSIYDDVSINKREPSTYEAMTRAFLAVEDHDSATKVVQELFSRGYPTAVAEKVYELVGLRNKQT